MGYYASGYGTITIRTDYDTPTLQKLYNSKTLVFRDGSKELQAETYLDLILDHDEAFEAVAYSEEHETTMDLTFCASENYHGELVEETLAFLAPVTVEGDIEFVGKDDCKWCFHYEDGKFGVYDGRTIYDCDHPRCPRADCVFSDGERCRSTLVKSHYASEQAVVHDRVVACTGYIPFKAVQRWTFSPICEGAKYDCFQGINYSSVTLRR